MKIYIQRFKVFFLISFCRLSQIERKAVGFPRTSLPSWGITGVWANIVHCCIPVSLLIGGWDWVQGGNPLYAAVKCLSDRRGQIWRIFFNFFAKSTCHIHFPGGIFFGGSKNFFYPLKWAILWGHLHFSKIEGPGCERTPFVYQFVCFRIDLTPSNN